MHFIRPADLKTSNLSRCFSHEISNTASPPLRRSHTPERKRERELWRSSLVLCCISLLHYTKEVKSDKTL
ncbi:unnamed protein product [Caretta caretta]